jgi:hypothetical protein
MAFGLPASFSVYPLNNLSKLEFQYVAIYLAKTKLDYNTLNDEELIAETNSSLH